MSLSKKLEPIPILIDADVLAFAHSSVGDHDEYDSEGNLTEHVIDPFDWLARSLRKQVDAIQEACGSSLEPYMFLTGDDNFRYDIATRKPYKGNRVVEKPYHFLNMRTHIRGNYNTYIAKGCEADDLLAMAQVQYRKEGIPSVIATIDKDLLQVPGWHYRWETYNSGEVPLHLVDEFGKLEGKYEEGVSEKTGRAFKRFITKSFKGEGYLWFMAQILTGDTVDNIPGLEGCGAKKAYETLVQTESKREALEDVITLYKEKYGDTYEEELVEQAQLVYMIQERDRKSPDGLKHWNLKDAIKDAESTKD